MQRQACSAQLLTRCEGLALKITVAYPAPGGKYMDARARGSTRGEIEPRPIERIAQAEARSVQRRRPHTFQRAEAVEDP